MNEQKKDRKPTRLPALVIATALGLSTASYAENYDVTVANDDGTGSTDNTLSWAIRQANVNAGADIITLKTDVTVTGVMKTLIDGTPSGGDHDSGGGDLFIQSDSTRRTISGGGQFRPLFVKSGTVTIQNLDLENGKAEGGDSNLGRRRRRTGRGLVCLQRQCDRTKRGLQQQQCQRRQRKDQRFE